MHQDERSKFESLSESALQDRLYNFFEQWFNVEFEVTSDCKKKRIDFLMFHKSDNQRLYPLGIELKKTDVKKGTEIARWCKQAEGYTKLSFKGYNPTVFICPQISGWYLDEGNRVSKHNVDDMGYLGAHHNVNSFLYQCFGFGEFQKYKNRKGAQSVRFVINTYIIWDHGNPNFLNINQLLKCR